MIWGSSKSKEAHVNSNHSNVFTVLQSMEYFVRFSVIMSLYHSARALDVNIPPQKHCYKCKLITTLLGKGLVKCRVMHPAERYGNHTYYHALTGLKHSVRHRKTKPIYIPVLEMNVTWRK